MKIFDTHAHYNDEKFVGDLYDVLKECEINNIKKIVNISANLTDSLMLPNFTAKLNEHIKNISFYYTMGVHPDEIEVIDNISSLSDKVFYNQFDELKNIVNADLKNDNNRLVAIGEIGLDYFGDYKNDSIKLNQKKWFMMQLALANELGLSVVIHSRDACLDTYEILKNYLSNNKGIIHCYSYSKEYLYKFLDLGLFIGVGGVLTFKNGIKLKECVEICPLDKIVLETDAPYLAPVPYRGMRNNSSYIKYILETICQIKKMDIDELSDILYQNSNKIYNLETNY